MVFSVKKWEACKRLSEDDLDKFLRAEIYQRLMEAAQMLPPDHLDTVRYIHFQCSTLRWWRWTWKRALAPYEKAGWVFYTRNVQGQGLWIYFKKDIRHVEPS